MELRRDSKLVKWAYWHRVGGPPYVTSLCRFFWRAFVFVPIFWLFISALIIGPIGLLLALSYNFPLKVAIVAIAVVAGYAYYNSGKLRTHGEMFETAGEAIVDKVAESTFWQGLRAVKGKMCPIIHIGDVLEDDSIKWYNVKDDLMKDEFYD